MWFGFLTSSSCICLLDCQEQVKITLWIVVKIIRWIVINNSFAGDLYNEMFVNFKRQQ
jgi:hypothetical protein